MASAMTSGRSNIMR